MKTIKVKITKCPQNTFWYADKIGQEFEVRQSIVPGMWELSGGICLLDKNNCEIVTDTITVTADKIRAMANKSVEAWEMMKAGFPEAFEEDGIDYSIAEICPKGSMFYCKKLNNGNLTIHKYEEEIHIYCGDFEYRPVTEYLGGILHVKLEKK